MILRVLMLTTLLLISNLSADYKTGKEIFSKKCSSCHGGYIDVETLKKNFFEEHNKLLNLTVPTINMLTYAILKSPKKIGDEEDPEMQKIEIEEYLKDYLYKPDTINSICDNHILKYYDKKKSMKGQITDKEIVHIVDYLYDYDKERSKNALKVEILEKDRANIDKVMEYAKKTGKIIIVEAMTPHCYFCRWMEKEVFSDKEVQSAIEKNFILFKVDMDKNELPLDLMKHYRRMTPSFFFVDGDGKLLHKYKGSWTKKDFLILLNENKK